MGNYGNRLCHLQHFYPLPLSHLPRLCNSGYTCFPRRRIYCSTFCHYFLSLFFVESCVTLFRSSVIILGDDTANIVVIVSYILSKFRFIENSSDFLISALIKNIEGTGVFFNLLKGENVQETSNNNNKYHSRLQIQSSIIISNLKIFISILAFFSMHSMLYISGCRETSVFLSDQPTHTGVHTTGRRP